MKLFLLTRINFHLNMCIYIVAIKVWEIILLVCYIIQEKFSACPDKSPYIFTGRSDFRLMAHEFHGVLRNRLRTFPHKVTHLDAAPLSLSLSVSRHSFPVGHVMRDARRIGPESGRDTDGEYRARPPLRSPHKLSYLNHVCPKICNGTSRCGANFRASCHRHTNWLSGNN